MLNSLNIKLLTSFSRIYFVCIQMLSSHKCTPSQHNDVHSWLLYSLFFSAFECVIEFIVHKTFHLMINHQNLSIRTTLISQNLTKSHHRWLYQFTCLDPENHRHTSVQSHTCLLLQESKDSKLGRLVIPKDQLQVLVQKHPTLLLHFDLKRVKYIGQCNMSQEK